MEHYYKIADLIVRMDTFGRTLEQAEPYRIDPCDYYDIQVESNWEARKTVLPQYSDSDGEYMSTSANFAKQLLDYDGLRLHSSAVVVDGNAYLFSADSGVGKSTHTKLWLQYFGNRAYILNDDKPALRLKNGCWYAYGTPWSGKNNISVNVGVPIAGIAMLHRSDKNNIQRWENAEAIAAIIKQANRPREAIYRIRLLELLDLLLRKVPVWKFTCNMELEAVEVAYSAMHQTESQGTEGENSNE